MQSDRLRSQKFFIGISGRSLLSLEKHLDEESNGKPVGFCIDRGGTGFLKTHVTARTWFETIDICIMRIAKKYTMDFKLVSLQFMKWKNNLLRSTEVPLFGRGSSLRTKRSKGGGLWLAT
jgi:hypothetical protein